MPSHALAATAAALLTAGCALLAAPAATAASREIPLPGLCGQYVTSGYDYMEVHSGVVLETPIAQATGARLHIRGTYAAGAADCGDHQFLWFAAFNIWLTRPGTSAWCGDNVRPDYPTGAFDVVSPPFYLSNPDVLRGSTIMVDAYFEPPNLWCEGDVSPYFLGPTSMSLTYAALIIDTPVAAETDSWGGVKALYGR